MSSEPSLWGLHHHSEADWRRILDTQPGLAVRWIRFAAERGFRSAQLVLGQMHLDGHGVIRDPALAYGWFVKAAAIGSLDARNMVGRCHELGWGVPVDHVAALSHYRHAAARGHGWAWYNVGCLLLYGAVRRSHAEAFRCFEAASRSDRPDARAKALGLLGRCHEEGWGTPADPAAAERCYAAAAESGDGWGALNLGLIHAERGDAASAATLLDKAVGLATPNGLVEMVRFLERRHEPIFIPAHALAKARLTRLRPPGSGSLESIREPIPSRRRRGRMRSSLAITAALVWTIVRHRTGRARRG